MVGGCGGGGGRGTTTFVRGEIAFSENEIDLYDEIRKS